MQTFSNRWPFLWTTAVVAGVGLPALAWAGVDVELISRSAGPGVPVSSNAYTVSQNLSRDGRFTLFESLATNLVPGAVDTNQNYDAFLYDRETRSTTLVSHTNAAAPTAATGQSSPNSISDDGRYVLFASSATDLLPTIVDQNNAQDVFLWDRTAGTMILVSRSPASATATMNGGSSAVRMTPDGRFVLFTTFATNTCGGVANPGVQAQLCLFDRDAGTAALISRSATNPALVANGTTHAYSISSDGRFVAVGSIATNLVVGLTDANNAFDSFVYDRLSGMFSLISHSAGVKTRTANGETFPVSMTSDGRHWVLQTAATNLVNGLIDANQSEDIYQYDRELQTKNLVSLSTTPGRTADGKSTAPVMSVSADGRFIIFASSSTDLVSGIADANGPEVDAYVYDRLGATLILASRSANSANTTGNGATFPIAISANGNQVLMSSNATDLASISSDVNGLSDAYMFDRARGKATLLSRSDSPGSSSANAACIVHRMSEDGRFALFNSEASNLDSRVSDTNAANDIFVVDTIGILTDGFED